MPRLQPPTANSLSYVLPCSIYRKLAIARLPGPRDSLPFRPRSPQGHMVPMDQPAAALHMLTRFTRDKPLTTPTEQLDEELWSPLEVWRVQPLLAEERVEGAEAGEEAAEQEAGVARLEAKARNAEFSGARRQETYRRDKYGDGEGMQVQEVEAEALRERVEVKNWAGLKEVLGRHGIKVER
jgi:hypothetical protein